MISINVTFQPSTYPLDGVNVAAPLMGGPLGGVDWRRVWEVVQKVLPVVLPLILKAEDGERAATG